MDTAQSKNSILTREHIGRKLRRMALEIAENNSGEKELIMAGIAGNGLVVAKSLLTELQKVASFSVRLIRVELNKKDPKSVRLDPPIGLEGAVVILVDDVADTGRTMLYALKPFLEHYPKKIQTLVLVERSHKQFPLQTDYVGLSVSTTLQEHIIVETKEEEIMGAWLY